MRITNVTPARTLSQPRGREADGKRTEQYRFRFSSAHIIVDLSPEALKKVGEEISSEIRPFRPRLFVYNDTGAFAYDAPAPINRITRSTTIIESEIDEPYDTEENLGVDETPIRSFVAFDGRLRSPAPL